MNINLLRTNILLNLYPSLHWTISLYVRTVLGHYIDRAYTCQSTMPRFISREL